MIILGLDLSLRSTGIALVGDINGLQGHITATVKGGDLEKDADVAQRLDRIGKVITQIDVLLKIVGAPAAVTIEGYAFPQHRTHDVRAAEMHELGGVVKWHLSRTYGASIIVAPVSSWRAQLGIPRIPKSLVPDSKKRTLELKRSTVQMIRTIWKVDFGTKFDEADAYALARYGETQEALRRQVKLY